MKYSAIAAALASASAAYAHTTVQAVFINGVDQGSGVGTYIRSPPDNSPVKDLTSSAVACNVNNSPVSKTLEVSSGDVITFEWAHNTRGDDIMDSSHKGPVQVYVAPTSSNGEGAVWAKIFSDGYTGTWATDTLIANKGHVSVTVPDLKAGEYLFRPEIVALHEADTAYNVNPARGVQLYMECVQFKIVSAGTKEITDGIDFKTSYTYSDGGLVYNLYTADPKTYVAPGGAVSSLAVAGQLGIGAVPAAGSNPSTAAQAAASTIAAAVTSTSAAPSTTAVAPTTTAAAATTSAAASTSRASLPTSKMSTVTVRSSTVAIPTVTSNVATPTASSCPTAAAGGNSGATVAKYYQCGGINYTGSTTCVSGTTCVVQNPYYYQCL